jgi:peptidoglycan/LPS O-acetylase OafA/YrhL
MLYFQKKHELHLTMQNDRLESIQYLRAIAALMVVVAHTIHTQFDGRADFGKQLELAGIFGQTGVWMFFCISGFIMVYTTNPKGKKLITSTDFMWRRFARIAPLYWLMSSIYLCKLIFTHEAPSPSRIISSFAFFPTLDSEGRIQPFYGLGWTLNYEFFFYVILASCLTFGPRRGSWLAISVLLVLTAYGTTLSSINSGSNYIDIAAKFWTKPIILFFVVGMLIAKVRLSLEKNAKSSIIVAPWAILLILTPSLLLLCASWAGNPNRFLESRGVIACLSVFLAILIEDKNDTFLHRLFLRLGEASFSIYLTHSFLVGPIGRIWAHHFSSEWWPFAALILLILTSAMGITVYLLIEKPVTKWVTNFRTS